MLKFIIGILPSTFVILFIATRCSSYGFIIDVTRTIDRQNVLCTKVLILFGIDRNQYLVVKNTLQ